MTDSADRMANGKGAAVQTLLVRMRHGDRDAAAEFITRYGTRIRRRIRGKLGPALRRVFDSEDVLSTLGRRLDEFVSSGRFDPADEDELWALLLHMARHAVIDKARDVQRSRRAEDGDGPLVGHLSRHRAGGGSESPAADEEVGKALDSLPDRIDRDILSMRLEGERHAAIARFVNLPRTAVEKRWQRIKRRLRRRLSEETHR